MDLKKYLCDYVIEIIKEFENDTTFNRCKVLKELKLCVKKYSECDCVNSTYKRTLILHSKWSCYMCGCDLPKKKYHCRIYSYFREIQAIKDKKIRDFKEFHESIPLLENLCERLSIDLKISEKKLQDTKKKYKIKYEKEFDQYDFYIDSNDPDNSTESY